MRHISEVYRPTDLNIYPLKGGKFAISSADPKFYMGIGENNALYRHDPPIPNAIADINNGALTQVSVKRFVFSHVGILGRVIDAIGAASWFDSVNPPISANPRVKSLEAGPERFISGETGRPKS